MTGIIVQISGSVVDVRFEQGRLPKIKEALTVKVNGKERVMEVLQHTGNHTVRCIMLSESEGLSRGAEITSSGSGIRVPVGECTLGRMFNVLGDMWLGDPTETALSDYITESEYNRIRTDNPRIDEIPFDSDRKLMTTVHNISGERTAYTKGAIDVLMPRMKYVLDSDSVREINMVCEGNMIMHLKGWYDKLREELYMLKNGIIANSDIITKFNNCLE